MLSKKLKRNVNILLTALKSAANAIVITDKEGIIQWANPAFTNITGFTLEEAIGKNMNLLKSNKHSSKFYKKMWQCIINGKIWKGEIINKKKNGKLYYEQMTIAPVVNKNKEITNFISIKQDITARKIAEYQLKENEKKFRYLFQEAEEFILNISPSGEILYSNTSWNRRVNYDLNQKKKISFSDFIIPEAKDKFINIINDIEFFKKDFHIQTELILKNQQKLSIDGKIYPIIREGRIDSLWMILRDVTKSKEIEEMKNEFISIVSHELKTPLTSIYAAIGLILNEMNEANEQNKNLLFIIQKDIERLIRLSNSILDVERLESGLIQLNVKPLLLFEILHRIVDLFQNYAQQQKVKIIIKNTLENVYILADEDALMQALTNLLSNAIKNSFPERNVEITIDKNENFARIAITNYGEEIKKEYHNRLFQKFAKINETKRGTGLGLYITKALIEKMAGKIYFTSTLEKGTTFYIELPIDYTIQNSNKIICEKKEENLLIFNAKILLVEDDIHIQKILKLSLEILNGVEVCLCSSGKEALQNLKYFQPDLILLDVNLPDMEGPTLMKEIQKDLCYQKTPIIFITAMSKPDDIFIYKNLGAIEVIMKPINIKAFSEIIKNCLLELKKAKSNKEIYEK